MELVALARNPVPSGAFVGMLKGYDGAELRFARWEPTRGPRRGTVCCFSGRTEFIEKYFETVADLRRRGFSVATMDWRGQGASVRRLANPRKGHIRGFSEYDRDLACFMREIVLPDCPPPYVALAHSMGGHILLRNAGTPGSWFERMVLVAPMLGFHPAQMQTSDALARFYAAFWSMVGYRTSYVRGGSDDDDAPTFEQNRLTSDRERWARNMVIAQAAPELTLGSPTIGWLHAAYRSLAVLNDPSYAARVGVPILFFLAGDDRIVAPRPIENFAARLKLGTLVLLPGAQHEILQERDEIRARFWSAFDAYLGVDEA
ncbi:MAG: alpha/beta fold hydrolase [Hyphomicrobiaceae bacterium]